jgi:hypothetical protein
MDENVRRKLVAIDEELGRVPLPRGLEARVLEGRAPARLASGWIVLAGAGAAAVLAFVIGRHTAPKPEPAGVAAGVDPVAAAPRDPPSDEATHTAPRDACPSSLGAEAATLLPLGCSVALSSPAMAIAAHTPVRIARTDRGVRVLEGDAFFAVETVEPGAPTVQVEVEGGTIEVLGTRFVVHQAGAEGHVDLLEGAIEFTAGDGTRRAVDPGRRLHWAGGAIVDDGAPVEAMEPDTAGEHPGPRIAPVGEGDAAEEPEVALDAVLDQVATLRRRGDYREAATLLRDTRASIRDAAASEILSYEEGTLREHYQAQEAACAFWRGHMRRFGESGRYATAVTGRLSRLGCTER